MIVDTDRRKHEEALKHALCDWVNGNLAPMDFDSPWILNHIAEKMYDKNSDLYIMLSNYYSNAFDVSEYILRRRTIK